MDSSLTPLDFFSSAVAKIEDADAPTRDVNWVYNIIMTEYFAVISRSKTFIIIIGWLCIIDIGTSIIIMPQKPNDNMDLIRLTSLMFILIPYPVQICFAKYNEIEKANI